MTKKTKEISIPIIRNGGRFCFSINEISNNSSETMEDVIASFRIPDGVEFHSAPLMPQGAYANGVWVIGNILPNSSIGQTQFCWTITDSSKAPFEFEISVSHLNGCSNCNILCITVTGLACEEVKQCLDNYVNNLTSNDSTLTVNFSDNENGGQTYDISSKYKIIEITEDYEFTTEFNYIRVNAESDDITISPSNILGVGVAGFSWVIKIVKLGFGMMVKLQVDSPNSIDEQLQYYFSNEKESVTLIHVGNGVYDLK